MCSIKAARGEEGLSGSLKEETTLSFNCPLAGWCGGGKGCVLFHLWYLQRRGWGRPYFMVSPQARGKSCLPSAHKGSHVLLPSVPIHAALQLRMLSTTFVVRQSPGIPSSSGSLPTSSRPFPYILSHKRPLRESLAPLTYTYHCIMTSLSTKLLSILLGVSDGQASTPSNLYRPVAGSTWGRLYIMLMEWMNGWMGEQMNEQWAVAGELAPAACRERDLNAFMSIPVISPKSDCESLSKKKIKMCKALCTINSILTGFNKWLWVKTSVVSPIESVEKFSGECHSKHEHTLGFRLQASCVPRKGLFL